ncbi:MAG: hypothetical protein WD844_07235 [Thermoleophilaceae bacterium]
MTPLTIAIAALFLGLLFGSIAVMGAPILALPIVLVALAVIGLGQMRRKSQRAQDIGELRDQAAAEQVEFTERDRETLT